MFDKIQVPDTVTLPKGKRACRRKADELRAAYDLHRRFAALTNDRPPSSEHLPQPGQRRLFDMAELADKKDWLRELSGDSQKALLRIFQKLDQSGPWRDVAKAPPPEVLDSLHEDFPNFDAVTKLIHQRLLLCRLAPERVITLPPILLNGPPGVGKTAYCQRLAGLLRLRFEKVDMSAAVASFSLTGLDAGYGNAHPGRIWESLQHDNLSVLWLLDEVDKVSRNSSHGGSEHLLGLLEPVSSKRFVDNCALLPIDASWICYIGTSNYKEQMDAPLLSRFEVIDIPAPDSAQLRAIVLSIYRDIRLSEAWGPNFDPDIDDAVIDALSALTPRAIRRRLFGACACAAAQSRRRLQASDIEPKPAAGTLSERRIGFI